MKSLQLDSQVDRSDCDRGRRAGCSSARHEQGGQTKLQRSDGKAPPGRLISARCNDGLPLHGLWPLADHSRMDVALENKDVVSDTEERCEVARIPASQAPRAIVLSARCSGQRAESRAA